jgi:glycosyltransferase involved in cell wall biosynthesis
MTRPIDLSLILPCYNEAGLFADSVSRIRDVLDATYLSYEIIFVDDKSSDSTPKLINKLVAKPRNTIFRAIYHDRNQGRGAAVTDGIRAAKGTVVGYIDIDCEVSPVYMPRMVTMILKKHADVVIGRRIYRTSMGSMLREILSRGYQWLSDTLIGTGGLDTETGYKFFARKKIVPILDKIAHKGWFWDTEIMVYAKRKKLAIVEIPVLFLRRFDKHSSVNIFRDTMDYMVHLIRFRNHLSHESA